MTTMMKLEVIGTLGGDAKIQENNGKRSIKFSVAHNDSYEQNGQKIETTQWINVTYYKPESKVIELLKKGATVYLRGPANVNAYKNKEGQWVAGVNMAAQDLIVTRYSKDMEERNSGEPVLDGADAEYQSDDDLPY